MSHLKPGENANNVSEKEWKERLTAQQFEVLREKGTEKPFSGKYYSHKETGVYHCAVCNNRLFNSTKKYDSGSGWPSFYDVINDPENPSVKRHEDRSHGMVRTEITCARCNSHLGHVFNDGPEETGQRYCINSVALQFEPAAPKSKTPAPTTEVNKPAKKKRACIIL